MIREGCILTARKIQESKIWTEKPAWWFKVWKYILIRVNHKSSKTFKRGENFFSSRMIYDNCHLHNEGITHKTVLNVIDWLKDETQIATRKTTRGIVITVLNYDKYQDLNNYKATGEATPRTESKRHGSDTINNNDNNGNNVLHTGKTPTREMMAIFTAIYKEFRDGSPVIDGGKDGKICKTLYKQCLADRPDDPLGLWKERIRTLMDMFDITSIGGVKGFWNSGAEKKKKEAKSWINRK